MQKKHGVTLKLDADVASFRANPESTLIKALQEASRGKISAQIFPAVSDAGPLVSNLAPELQKVVQVAIIGPGKLHGNAHSDHENVPINQLEEAFLIYRRAYKLWAKSATIAS